jgi:hypothetical protein
MQASARWECLFRVDFSDSIGQGLPFGRWQHVRWQLLTFGVARLGSLGRKCGQPGPSGNTSRSCSFN